MKTHSFGRRSLGVAAAIAGLTAIFCGGQALADVTIDSASWDGRVLTVRGSGENRDTVTLINANDPNQVLGTRDIGRRGSWRIRDWRPDPVPCAVAASAQGQEPVIREVRDAPGELRRQTLQAGDCSIAVDPTSRNFGDVNAGQQRDTQHHGDEHRYRCLYPQRVHYRHDRVRPHHAR